MWAKQHLSAIDIDYAVWERDKSMLHQLSKMGRNCTFVVDVYKCKYAYASPNFVDLLGYDSHKIETLERQGDYLESRIHPDDRAQLAALQVTLSQFIYSLPFEQRNNYSNIYSFRMLNAKQQYIRVTSRHQVLEQDRNGKAWLIIEILRLIQKGLFSKEIADKLCISIHTVNIHRQNLLRKLGVQNSIEAIRLGQESGLLS